MPFVIHWHEKSVFEREKKEQQRFEYWLNLFRNVNLNYDPKESSKQLSGSDNLASSLLCHRSNNKN